MESLAAARNRCGNEPSDATRVVNAVLTQLDNIKRMKNVLILTSTLSVSLTVEERFKEVIYFPSQHPMSRE